MHDQERAVYVISVAAELAGVHPQTLRIYERKGLLQPARTGGGSRRYSQADIDLLCRIQDLTTEGLNLVGVARILELEDELARTREELDRLREDAQRQIEQARREAEEHRRSMRRDLVPLRQEVVLYRDHGAGGPLR
ncbi:MAG: MerR family transcriptional regulator [Microthrixaceae bacterium]